MKLKTYRLALITEEITQDTETNTVELKRLAEITLMKTSDDVKIIELGQDICFEFGENIENDY